MVLLRRVIGDALRTRRQGQRRTLREVSTAANVSLGYLSEIERGQKEASSELLASICDALGARLSEVLREVSDTVALAEQMPDIMAPAQERPAAQSPPRQPAAQPVPHSAVGSVPRRSTRAVRERQLLDAAARTPGVRPETPVRTVTDGGGRTVAVDGNVSVSVRQDSPLKATLRTTRRLNSAPRDRDVVCAA